MPGRAAEIGLAPLDEVFRRHIGQVLQSCRGKIDGPGGAAERLSVHPSTLRAKMRKLGIAASSYQDDA